MDAASCVSRGHRCNWIVEKEDQYCGILTFGTALCNRLRKTVFDLYNIPLWTAVNGLNSVQQTIDVISVTNTKSVFIVFVYNELGYASKLALLHWRLVLCNKDLKHNGNNWVFGCFHVFRQWWPRGDDRDNYSLLFVKLVWPPTWNYVLAFVVKVSCLFCWCKCPRHCRWTGTPDVRQNVTSRQIHVGSEWSSGVWQKVKFCGLECGIYCWVCDAHS